MSKIRQKIKNDPIVERSTRQVSDIIINEISKLSDENFWGRCILQLLHIVPSFQNFKNSPKIQKNVQSSKKAQAMLAISYLTPV